MALSAVYALLHYTGKSIVQNAMLQWSVIMQCAVQWDGMGWDGLHVFVSRQTHFSPSRNCPLDASHSNTSLHPLPHPYPGVPRANKIQDESPPEPPQV